MLWRLAAIFLLSLLPAALPAQQLKTDAECLACHGEKGLKSEKGRNISVEPGTYKSSVHAPLGCQMCHADIKEFPHPQKVVLPKCATCHDAAAKEVPNSLHGQMLGAGACASCHGPVHAVARAGKATGQLCSTCHADALKQFQSSIHAQARKNGDQDSPLCASCHGSAHKMLLHSDPASPVAKKNLAETCGACHANPDFLARHKIDFARPVETYRLSVHGRAVAAGNEAAPSCSDCHSSHAIFRASDARAKIHHASVPSTCGTCHSAIRDVYLGSVHGQAVQRGVRNSPVCTDCHGEHSILSPSEPGSLVNPSRVSSVTCGHCHADERLTARYNLPTDKVPTFRDSFHGLSSRAGRQTVANCASCHGVHNILPSSDPRSMIHSSNLANTCGQCHPGAGSRFALGPVHVKSESENEHAVVRFIRVSYWIIIPLTIGFMLIHNGLDFFAKLIRGVSRVDVSEQVPRMNRHFRMAHWLVQISFVTLVITGFALKFPESWWAAPIVAWEKDFPLRGNLHRTAAVVMLAGLAYHFVHLAVRKRDRVMLREMIPTIQDARDLVAMLRYNLGLSRERPLFGKFSYGEKLEYFAFLWGTVVMSVTGFLLWFENFTLRNFPSWVADASTALHWYEAILATLAIIIWHFYAVIFDPEVYPMDKAWLTGKVPAAHLRHTRPAYLAQILSSMQQNQASAAAEAPVAPDEEKQASSPAEAPAAPSEPQSPERPPNPEK
ncbi:MAG TPA: cytochrome b/b6 domain-containing protein [Candidatus Nitrosotenuis sp.]|nr:cytochrome b/b6 domain-containing protein [Candidatus Nitrosotenuis sp.]